MAIDPSTDIIVDVIKAADPQRAAATAQRLAALGNAQAPEPASFAAALDQSARLPSVKTAAAPYAADARSRLSAVNASVADKAARAQVEFEAVLLNSFVSEMLPKNTSNVFGQGLAGDMWKSMLADQISRQVAKSGALGIGKQLFATHPLNPHGAGEHINAASAASTKSAAQMSANVLSLPADAVSVNGELAFAASGAT